MISYLILKHNNELKSNHVALFGAFPCLALGAQITPTPPPYFKKKIKNTQGKGDMCAPSAKHGKAPNFVFMNVIILVITTPTL